MKQVKQFIPEFTKKEPEKPVEPEKTGISTYEELVAFAENVKNDYDKYGSADVYLENNLLAPDDSAWVLGIGTADNPFNGTFDGRGYGIVGLNVSIDDLGGLFGCIGENGLVKDIAVIDCDFTKNSEYAGGIAAVNNGTIDHCLSGINQGNYVRINDKNGNRINIGEYNSYIKGTYSGGVAATNNGTITGTRNGAFVNGSECGGLVYENAGTIYGCANNGPVGKDSVNTKLCGGLVCRNSGTISCCYNSGKPTGSSGGYSILGMAAAFNESENISNVFCNSINDIPASGDGSTVDLSKTVTVISNEEMLDASFTAKLNDVTDDTVQWEQKVVNNTYLNSKYPVILGNFLKNRTITLNNGIALKGLMHQSMNVYYNPIKKGSDDYALFSKAAPNGISTIYNAAYDDGKGTFIPAEFWCSGVTISVPVESNDVKLAVMGTDGAVQVIKPDSIRDGKASFSAAAPVSFAVIKTTSSGAKTPDSNNNRSSSAADSNTVSTGDSTAITFALAVLAFSAAMIFLAKRKKNRE